LTIFFDTSTNDAPITASGEVFVFGTETEFWLSAASNIVVGQGTGPSVQLVIQSKVVGQQIVQVDYATATTPAKYSGTVVTAIVPSGNPVSVRLILADTPTPVVPIIIGTATSSGSFSVKVDVSILTVGATPVFTCPTGYRAVLLQGRIAGDGKGGSATMFTAYIRGFDTSGEDYLVAVSGISVTSAFVNRFGSLPACEIVIPIGRTLWPGDIFYGNNLGGGTTVPELTVEFGLIPT
jgi:hypothetical protein